jgi:hypothetical protein
MGRQLDIAQEARAAVINSATVMTDDGLYLSEHDLYVVWSVKVLDHWKALVSTDVLKGAYWEVTRNGIKEETYVDRYAKVSNVRLRDL